MSKQEEIYKMRTDAVPPCLPLDRLETIPIPLPPLPVQQEIVRILDSFTELTAELKARKKQYAYYRDALFRTNCIQKIQLKDISQKISTGKLNANAMVENGAYPFFTCDATPYRIDTYAFDTEAILISGNGSQIGHVNYYNGKFNAYQRTYVLSDFKFVSAKYIYYFLKAYIREYIALHSRKGSVPYITLPMLQNFDVLIPKDKTTEKNIIATLDRFDSLCNNLTSGLPAEIDARKKQYEYYRNKLLSFQEAKNDI